MLKTFLGPLQRPVTRSCSVEWNREIGGSSEVEKIDRVRRAHAQRHGNPQAVHNVKTFDKNQKFPAKFTPCVYFNKNACSQNKNHENKSIFIDIFVLAVGNWMEKHMPILSWTAGAPVQKTSNNGQLNPKVHHVQKTKIFYNTKFQALPPVFQSRLHMKRVFCRGLTAFNFRDNRSYAAVVDADTTSCSPMGLDNRKVLGLFPKNAFSLDERPIKPVTSHKETMCNDDRNTNVLGTVTDKHVLPTRSFHKRTVGQGHEDTSGRVLPVHNRFIALYSDSQTQDTDSIMDDQVHFSQSPQVSKRIYRLDPDIVTSTRASTSQYICHNSCYSSHNIIQQDREQLGSKFGCLPLSPILLYNGNPSHRSDISDVLQAHIGLLGKVVSLIFWT